MGGGLQGGCVGSHGLSLVQSRMTDFPSLRGHRLLWCKHNVPINYRETLARKQEAAAHKTSLTMLALLAHHTYMQQPYVRKRSSQSQHAQLTQTMLGLSAAKTSPLIYSR